MKKFFTVVPLQLPGQLNSCRYEAVGNIKLQMDSETRFPIITAINGYAQAGEEIRIIAVVQDTPSAWGNLNLLKDEVSALCAKIGTHCRGVEEVVVPNDDSVSACTGVFQKLLDFADDNDELFACMTYGTKPLSMALNMAVQYAYRVKNNNLIGCFVYGKFDRDEKKTYIYDMTALVQLDEIVRLLADRKVTDPKGMIDALMSQ